ncbi:MAG: colanic acid biosynthesis glycosyltransferase WcaL, partial [Acidimicrobiales bacterium]
MLSEIDREEARTTQDLLPATPVALISSHLRLWRNGPRAWAATLVEALRASPPGARAFLWQFFYVVEAVLLYEWCRRSGIRRLHAHLANVAADVAWLTTRIGQRCEPGAGWRWSFTMHGPTELSEVARFNLRRKVEAADAVVCISNYCRSQLMRVVSPDQWPKLTVVRC